MLDDDALNLVGDVIESVHRILQMLVDLAAANELERVPAFDLLIEQFQAAVVGVVGVPFDARDLQADLVQRRGVLPTSASIETPRDAQFGAFDDRVGHFAHVRFELVISNSMMAFAVALH